MFTKQVEQRHTGFQFQFVTNIVNRQRACLAAGKDRSGFGVRCAYRDTGDHCGRPYECPPCKRVRRRRAFVFCVHKDLIPFMTWRPRKYKVPAVRRKRLV